MRFLRALRANNNRDWFQEHKAEFDAECQVPLERLAADLLVQLVAVDPAFTAFKPKDLIYRIYRDTRFSPDKTPYKTHLALSVVPTGRRSELPGLYVHMGLDEFAVYAGVYMPSSEQLMKIRQEILYHHDELQGILTSRAFKSTFGAIQGEAISRPPKGFAAEDVAEIPLLKNKQFYVGAALDRNLLTSPQLADEIVRLYQLVEPFNAFFRRALQD